MYIWHDDTKKKNGCENGRKVLPIQKESVFLVCPAPESKERMP